MNTKDKKPEIKKPEIKKPSIDTSRFSALLEEKQDTPAFPEPEKVTIQSHQVVCFAPNRNNNIDKESKKILYTASKQVQDLLENHTSGSTSSVIDKLLTYAIEDLLKRNISIK